MRYRLKIKPSAEKDIAESYSWYNKQREGLGDIFLEQLERSLEFLKSSPNQYQVRYNGIRMVKVYRFPFCLHYTIEDDVVFIHAVLSTSRDPEIWKRSE